MPEVAALLERFRGGDRLALARLLSLAARGDNLNEILAALPAVARPSRVIAFTGSGGVGKSTLVGQLIGRVRTQGPTVAVLACDPQSPLSGGALLGDRFRMPSRPGDDGVFIRSLAAAAGHGAVAEHLGAMVRLLEAFGFDVIFIETVGAGQGDTAVRDLADVVVLLLQPETGDDLQWEKAGVLEVADVFVIHKADLPGAEQVGAQVRAALSLVTEHTPPVLLVSSRTGAGLEALWQAIRACPLRRSGGAEAGQELLRLAQDALARRFARAIAADDPALRRLIMDWQQGRVPEIQVAAALWHLLGSASGSPS
jgi:LAO/AO transport system ATPase